MPYALPANFNNTTAPQNGQSSFVQQESDISRADRNIAGTYPGSTILDIENGQNGRPQGAHIRDASGQVRTVSLDDNQSVAGSEDGYR